MKKWLKILIISLISLAALILAVAGAGSAYVWSRINKNPDQVEHGNDITQNSDMFQQENEKDSQSENSASVGRKEGFYNVLVIGRDKVALNTDVMIVASFDTKNGKAATVQIPRDSYVEDKDGNKSKINAVFARGYTSARTELNRLKNAAKNKSDAEIKTLCEKSSISVTPEILKTYMSGTKAQADVCSSYGIKLLQDVISHTFGIYFDYYAIVSTDAFVKIVDAVGGVDVYIQEDMNYDDPFQDLHIHLKKGQQHLNGKQAEGFVRFRSGYVQADIARLDAQKIFLTAFFKKLTSFSTVTKVDDIVRAVFDSVNTDMTIDNALGFVKPALSLDLSGITMLNMQGTPYNNGMYYSLNKAENLKIVNEHFNIFTRPLSENAVNVIELVKDSGGAANASSGMTMEDITEKQPTLGFVGKNHGVSATTPPSADNNGKTENTNPVTTEPETETENENESEGEPESETETETEPETKIETAPEEDEKTESETEKESEPGQDPETSPEPENAPEPEDKPLTEPEDGNTAPEDGEAAA